MKKNALHVIKMVSLLLIGSILLSGCAALEQLGGAFTKATEATESTQSGAPGKFPWATIQTEPAVDTAAALTALRASVTKEYSVAVAYLGEFDIAPTDLRKALQEAAPGFCQQYPFVLEVAEERILGSCGELYCIVTREADAAIAVTKSVEGEYTYDQGIAILEGAEAVLLFANGAGWSPDTLVNITDSTGTYDWYPTLNDYLCTSQMLDADWNNRLMDITPYTEQLALSYRERQENGWKLPTQADLLGKTWSCKEWTNDGTQHRYEVTFNEGSAYVRWNNGYDAQDLEYPAAPYTLETKDGFAVVTFDFGEFAGKQVFNILLDEESGMLYTMVDVTGDTVKPGWDRLYRTLQ